MFMHQKRKIIDFGFLLLRIQLRGVKCFDVLILIEVFKREKKITETSFENLT